MNAWKFGLAVFLLQFVRYSLFSVLPFFIFWHWKKNRFQTYRIQKNLPPSSHFLREIQWSLTSFVIFSFLFGALVHFGYLDISRIYTQANEWGYAYFFASILMLLILHDAFFYWAHRFMHWRLIYPKVHKLHHLSTNPSPLAAFSFHPLEALVEAAIVVVMPLFIPVHPIALGIFFMLSHAMNSLGHLGYEFFPSGFTTHPVYKWLNTSTHHNLHHQYFRSNYGLYLNFWDRVMGTNDRDYERSFERIRSQRRTMHPKTTETMMDQYVPDSRI